MFNLFSFTSASFIQTGKNNLTVINKDEKQFSCNIKNFIWSSPVLSVEPVLIEPVFLTLVWDLQQDPANEQRAETLGAEPLTARCCPWWWCWAVLDELERSGVWVILPSESCSSVTHQSVTGQIEAPPPSSSHPLLVLSSNCLNVIRLSNKQLFGEGGFDLIPEMLSL